MVGDLPSGSSYCTQENNKKNTKARPQSTDVLSAPPPPPPPPPGPEFSSVAYACDSSKSAGFYKLGSGVEHLHGKSHTCWLKTLGGFSRDVLELFKEVFRGRPDPFTDLRGRRPVTVVLVSTTTTITAVRNPRASIPSRS